MRRILRALARCSMFKRIDENALTVTNLTAEAIGYAPLSTTPVAAVTHGGKTSFFRECAPRETRNQWLCRSISRFFEVVERTDATLMRQKPYISLTFSPESVALFRQYLTRKQGQKAFSAAMRRADRVAQSHRFSIWEPTDAEAVTADFGMADVPRECRDLALYFAQYMSGAAAMRRTRGVVCGRAHDLFAAGKAVATRLVAEKVGLAELIPPTAFCKIKMPNGESRFGVLSAQAPGERLCEMQSVPDIAFRAALTDLELLDALCFQPDHGANNCTVSTRAGKIRLCAFDNDHPSTFLPLPTVRRAFAGRPPLVDRRGCIDRACIRAQTAQRLQNADVAALKRDLRPYLNGLQIAALVCRLHKLCRALRKTQRHYPTRIMQI